MNKAVNVIKLVMGIVWLVVVIALITRVLPDQVRMIAAYFLAINVLAYMAWSGYQSWKKRKIK